MTSPVPDLYYQRRTPTGTAETEMVSLSTRMILQAATQHGVTFREIPETRVFELKHGDQTRYFHAQIPWSTREVGFFACLDKNVTKGFLRAAGIATPNGYHITKDDPESYWLEVYEAVAKPLVVKPTNANQGRGVFMNLHDVEHYLNAVRAALAVVNDEKAGVVVEETVTGTEYRVLATPDKVIGIINRLPANVVGDGVHTIKELVAEKNSDPRRSERLDEALIKIPLDDHVLTHLASQNLTIDSVPALNERIFLRLNSNISTGGDSIDVTDEAHPSVKSICLRAMQAIPGLALAGVDFITTDITVEQQPGMYSIIEINSSPGFCIHDLPYFGQDRKAAEAFLFLLFPELA